MLQHGVEMVIVAWPSWSEAVCAVLLAVLFFHCFVEGLLDPAIVGGIVFGFVVCGVPIFSFVVFWVWLQSVIGRLVGVCVLLGFGVFWDSLQSGFGCVIWREIFGIVVIIFWEIIFADLGDGDVVTIIHACDDVAYGCGIIVTTIVGIIVGGGDVVVVVVIVIVGAGVPGFVSVIVGDVVDVEVLVVGVVISK
jgi:hypothetical protein